MIGKFHFFAIAIVALGLSNCSCSEDDRPALVWDDGTSVSVSSSMPADNKGDFAEVAFTEKNGVKYVPVKINGVPYDMILDTGASSAHISLAEAQYLYTKGLLTDSDFIGIAPSQTASGDVDVNLVVNLKDVVIDGKVTCHDVIATVAANVDAPLLLGNDVLDRAGGFEIDNNNKKIIFKGQAQ